MERITKRCEKCGGTSLVPPRARRCKRQNFGPASYACWGKLAADKPKPLPVQERALRDHQRAERMLEEKLTELARLTTSIREWRRKSKYYAERASLTDAELAARKVRTRKPKIRRGIKL